MWGQISGQRFGVILPDGLAEMAERQYPVTKESDEGAVGRAEPNGRRVDRALDGAMDGAPLDSEAPVHDVVGGTGSR